MKYQALDPIDRNDALEKLETGDEQSVVETILRLALHDPGGPWVTEIALNLLGDNSLAIRRAAVLALGHIARLHGEIDERAVPALQKMLSNPDMRGRAKDALSDIDIFTTSAGE
ncbi:hypothetical protein [Nocardia carnea]|uniref:HEAT repeat domain-containing protein n=1 Tax=Nocardia carnea TaxID=37328 RepID=A0ABW7TNK0_9NOCA|nr:hypothetical protein [Nocardia carnea]